MPETIGSNSGVNEFLDWIYRDATIFMLRKFDKYAVVKSLKKR